MYVDRIIDEYGKHMKNTDTELEGVINKISTFKVDNKNVEEYRLVDVFLNKHNTDEKNLNDTEKTQE